MERADEDRCERKVMLSLLESIGFETITLRYEAIPDAHKRILSGSLKIPNHLANHGIVSADGLTLGLDQRKAWI